MNKQRRKDIDAIRVRVEALTEQINDFLTDDVESIRDEEQDYYDAMPLATWNRRPMAAFAQERTRLGLADV